MKHDQAGNTLVGEQRDYLGALTAVTRVDPQVWLGFRVWSGRSANPTHATLMTLDRGCTETVGVLGTPSAAEAV